MADDGGDDDGSALIITCMHDSCSKMHVFLFYKKLGKSKKCCQV